MPGGGAPEGAFERFLTAALATIITIMFSWRLLQEENEASGARERTPFPAPSPVTAKQQYQNMARSRYRKHSSESSSNTESAMGNQYDLSLDELDETNIDNNVSMNSLSDSSVRETVTNDKFVPFLDPSLGATPPSRPDDNLSKDSNLAYEGDTLTTWDDYNWEEETGREKEHVIKTRRSVRIL